MIEIRLSTSQRVEALDITSEIQRAIRDSGVKNGIVVVYVPHTTAGITINEGADPDVMRDVIDVLTKLVPEKARYRHTEGNADSHVKATLCGSGVTVIVEDGSIVLGTWQKIFFMEFDGPRTRKVWVKVLEA